MRQIVCQYVSLSAGIVCFSTLHWTYQSITGIYKNGKEKSKINDNSICLTISSFMNYVVPHVSFHMCRFDLFRERQFLLFVPINRPPQPAIMVLCN